MTKEVKIGLVAIIAILLSIWGYKFVKGQNLFNKTQNYYTTFSDVTALPSSAPVLLNGFKVGQVTEIKLNPKDVKLMNVYVRIEGDIPVPKNARFVMKSEGLVGGKMLALEFDKPCGGSDCAESDQFIQGHVLGLIGSMVGEGELDSIMGSARSNVQLLVEELGRDGNEGKIDDIVRNLDLAVKGVADLSKATQSLVNNSNANIAATLKNVESITRNLSANNAQISETLKNMTKITEEIQKSNLSNTVGKTNTVLDGASSTMTELSKTIKSLDNTVKELNTIADNINSGKGTAGKLMTDQQLYENITKTSREINLLLQDLRLNPKRYVNVSVFGKKNKEYVLPEDDPAIKEKQ